MSEGTYGFDWVFGKWPWREGGKCACWKFLAVDVLIVPRSSDQVERVAGVIREPIVGLITAVVLLVIKYQIHADEDTSPVIANHEHINKQHHKRKGNPSNRLILQVINDLILIFELLDPNQPSRNELDKVDVKGLSDKRNDVDHKHCYVEIELGCEVVSLDLGPIIHHSALAEGIVPFEETKHDVEAEEEDYQYVEGAMDAVDVQLLVEECRPKGKRQWDLYFHEVKDHKEGNVPE